MRLQDGENKCDKDIDGLLVPWFGWWLWDSKESRKPIYASDSACDYPRFRKDNEGEKDDR